MRHDVVIVGAGLAGLACAHDLLRSGADVVLVEARDRPGGRVEGVTLADGRIVQMGGELVGTVHRAYRGLVAELGLELEPSYVAEPGEDAWDLAEGVRMGEGWLTSAEGESLELAGARMLGLAATVDPADPWGHPDAVRLDRLSIGDLLRDCGVTGDALRMVRAQSRSAGAGTVERLGVLGLLRAAAAGDGHLLSEYDAWEDMRLVGGSSRLVDVLSEEVGERLRLSCPVDVIEVGSPCSVQLPDGERIEAEAIVCAVPVGPLRDIRITGLSDARQRSLHAQREALASKAVVALDGPVWRDHGWSGLCASERDIGGFWPQSDRTLSALLGPEQIGYVLAETQEMLDTRILAGLERLIGAVEPVALLWRHWGTDPYTRGYVTHWAPGDVVAVGPLHGTHEPPFYVCGSDHWAAGYMEGAVATGRAAARSLIESRVVPVYDR